ncbi:hypothetical protein MNBD_CHLOROFLEXI01-5289 [hydrothermal vent metagenome]|uniref:NAD-dependent epimerase/dehydratase domain-containing protein n=1 Tax=hydrothermal vent metagenome TaxID=652676 RepID=A0A3B0VGH5_9ZZZZ
MKIGVTGGNGDLGRSLIPYLIEQGHTVVSIDRSLPPIPNPRPANMPDYLIADVTDFGEVVAALSRCDAVVHLAAHRSPLNHPTLTIPAAATTSCMRQPRWALSVFAWPHRSMRLGVRSATRPNMIISLWMSSIPLMQKTLTACPNGSWSSKRMPLPAVMNG